MNARIALPERALDGKPPINLFRLFARNPTMSAAMTPWGEYTLGKSLSVSMRVRELVIDRTCARCGAEYEWGVHVDFFAERVGLDAAQIASITYGEPDDACWTDAERAVLHAVDELHDTDDLGDATWAELSSHYTDDQIVDVVLLAGWYHAISYVARAARVPLEDGAPRFADYARPADSRDGEPGSG
jgi:alkylhydroperoxidase family enzyme